MIKVEGKFGISATVVCHSITESGIHLLTFETEKPRIILAEENTHRGLSKNSASSRAIPFAKMKEQLRGRPVRFGQANAGMQDKGEDYEALIEGERVIGDGCNNATEALWPEEAWERAREDALKWSERFYKAGYHKQVYNRLTEAFQMMKTVVSGTEWANFFWLRDDGAADPTIAELARVMNEARNQSVPMVLKAGEWHLPYVERYRDADGVLHYGDWVQGLTANDREWRDYDLEDAIKISAARSAAVSFRNVDYGLEKSREVHERLVGDERKHASALEHQATPIKDQDLYSDVLVNIPECPSTWEEGISHMDRDCNLWSGNFKGWIQYRKLIAGENKAGY